MPTIRHVPVYYATIADAIAAADPGDTLLLDPGVYSNWVMYISKPVHIKANTNDVYGNQVRFNGGHYNSYNDNSTLVFSFAYDADVPQVIIEGIVVSSMTGGNPGYEPSCIKLKSPGTQFVFNKCVIEGPDYSVTYQHFCDIPDGNKVLFNNCSRPAVDGTGPSNEITDVGVNSEIMFTGCFMEFQAPWVEGGIESSMAVWADDSVRTATEGYGIDYGSWILDNTDAISYRIAGKIAGDISPEVVQVRLYVAEPGGITPCAWSVTNPDVDGNWGFEYLPIDAKYYVAIIPPEGYQPELIGPYDPEQN